MGASISGETDIERREEENKHKRPFTGQYSQGRQKFERPNYSSVPSKGTFSTTHQKEIKSYPMQYTTPWGILQKV